MPQIKTVSHILAGVAALVAGFFASSTGAGYLHSFGLGHPAWAPVIAGIAAAAIVYHNPEKF